MKKILLLMLLVALAIPACAAKTTPKSVAANTATYGTMLVQGVDAVRKAVVDAEAKGALPRNEAVKVMQGVVKVAQQAETISGYLNVLSKLPGSSAEVSTTVSKIQLALDLLSTDAFGLMIPIGPEGTRMQVSQLLAEVAKIIGTINRDVLGRL